MFREGARRRRLVGLLLAVGAVMSLSAATAVEAAARTVNAPSSVVVEISPSDENGGCTAIAFLQISIVPGATSYSVDIFDTEPRVNRSFTITWPPFPQDAANVDGTGVAATPAGTHRQGLSSLSGHNCGEAKANFLNPARWRITRSVATLDCPSKRPRGAAAGSSARAPGAEIARNRSQSDRDWYSCWGSVNQFGGVIASGAGWLTTRYISRSVLFSGPEAIPLAAVLVGGGQVLSYFGRAQVGLGLAQAVMANDPPDPRFRTIARPRPKRAPKLRVRDSLTRKLAPKVDAVLLLESRMIAFSKALQVSIDRAGGAHLARQAVWERRQMLAASGYAAQLAKLLETFAVRSKQLADALLNTKLARARITAANVQDFQAGVARSGLPRALVTRLKGFGYTNQEIAAFKQFVLTTGLTDLVGQSPFGVLRDPDVLSALRGSATQLRSFSRTTKANPHANP